MKKIAFIPIDNRPVCYQLPQQIVALSEENEIYLPAIENLGDLKKRANVDNILDWLENLENIDILVLSLDTIAYGGLIPSRRCEDSFIDVKYRIKRLVDIIRKKNISVYAFSSIMRISNNNINEEEKLYWNLYGERIFHYSYNLHKMEKTNSCENLLACNCAASKIPEYILDDYINTRKRNFEINKEYIELYNQGIFDTLVFSKDDCAEYGFNVKEAEELSRLAQNCEGVFVKTGADEIPLTLLSRALNEHKRIRIAPKYMNPDSINLISKYEDISVEESVKSQIELAGGVFSEEGDADLIMLVNNFKKEQGELVMDVYEKGFSGELELPDSPYFIADILNANGSDNEFVNKLLAKSALKEFFGYTAWNTTGNTLGCALAIAMNYYAAKIPNENAFATLQLIRFLDDWAYQANVRKNIRENKNNLTNNVITGVMEKYEQALFKHFEINNFKVEYNFPWDRFFEIQIDINKEYLKIPFVDILFYE